MQDTDLETMSNLCIACAWINFVNSFFFNKNVGREGYNVQLEDEIEHMLHIFIACLSYTVILTIFVLTTLAKRKTFTKDGKVKIKIIYIEEEKERSTPKGRTHITERKSKEAKSV